MDAISQELAEKRLNRDLPLIFKCINDAWEKYMQAYPANLRIAHSARSRASLIHDHIVEMARKYLEPRIGVACHEINKLFLVSFDSGIVIRFKKLDDSYRSSNIRTQQSLGFMEQSQLPLPEIDTAINLQAGYRLNALETQLQGIYLTHPTGEQANAWVMELERSQFNFNNVKSIASVPDISQQKAKRIRITKRGGDKADEAGKS